MNRDVQVILFDTRKLSGNHDAVLMGIDVYCREPLRGGRSPCQAVHLLLQTAQFPEWTPKQHAWAHGQSSSFADEIGPGEPECQPPRGEGLGIDKITSLSVKALSRDNPANSTAWIRNVANPEAALTGRPVT